MSRRKTERLLSLVVCLLSARRYLTAAQIRDAVPGYPDSFEAFKRMFERDKDELRELGIPLETGINPGSEEESGYRISRQAYELPEIRLEPDEAAVLGLAARVWRRAELAGAAEGALLKLRAAGIEAEDMSQPGIEPRLQTGEAAFGPLWEAVRDRRPVTFGYLAAGRSTAQQRKLDPWGVVNRRGRWYVVGLDGDRGEQRVFRLSRISGKVELHRAGRVGHGAAGHRRARRGPGLGHRRPAAADLPAADPGRGRSRPATPCAGHPARPGRAGLGSGRGELHRHRLVERAHRVVRRRRRGDRAGRPARGRDRPAEGGAGMTADPAIAPRPGRRDRPTATDRLQRLLALVPYVVSRNAVGMAETAAAFGITEPELVDDLNMLWCVELRSPDPYCPIDLSYEGGEIVVSEAEAMDRPLRLGVDEACALLIGLRMLAELPSIGDGSALSRTIAKLEAAAGSAANPSAQVAVQVDHLTGASMTAEVTDALSHGRRVHISYYVPGRDEATERDVDPMRLLVVEGRSYLEGWCRRASAVRLFRLDRILSLEILEVAAEVPAGAEPVDVDGGLFRPSPQDVLVELELTAAGRWVAEYYPCERAEDLPDGRLRITLRTPDTQWVRRLALRLGEDGRVVAPPELAARGRDDAKAALAHYA